jgi:hypothetical protein
MSGVTPAPAPASNAVSIIAKKRRLFNGTLPQPALSSEHNTASQAEEAAASGAMLLSILCKMVEEISANRALITERSNALERKIDDLSKKLNSASRIDSLITRLDSQMERLTKEISDLQVHALHGFSSLNLSSDDNPYTHI